MQHPRTQNFSLLKILLHIGFFASGIATVLIGQVLPVFKQKFNLDDDQLGNFFPVQLAGSLIGTILTNGLGKRNKFLEASSLGCLLMGIGVLSINFSIYELSLLGFFINGIGIGLTLPSINMLILELNPLRSASSLNILNFFWGVGAIVSQPFVDYFSTGTNIWIPSATLSTILIIIGIALIIIREKPSSESSAVIKTSEDYKNPIWTTPLAWMIAAFSFVNVGFESAMGGWLKTYTQRIDESPSLLPPILIYFLFFVVGRGIAPYFFRFWSENIMLMINLWLIFGGMVVILLADNTLILSVGAAIVGLGTSSVFPTNMSRFTNTFGASASRRAMPFFICGSLGSAFTTKLIGYVSSYFNSLNAGMFILLGSSILLIILQTILHFQIKKKS